MTITINAQGAERKRLVQTVSDWLGVPAKYCGAPSFNYEVDYFTIDRNGSLSFDDRADRIFFGGEFIRFLLKLFVTERDFAGFAVGLQNDEVVSLVEFQNFGRLADFLPAEIADVSEAVVTFDAHERSERSKAFDLALNDSAGNDG